MQILSDIQFNNNLYSQIDHWVLILYQLNGTSIAIPLSNVDLLIFINPFDDVPRCQTHISPNHYKKFTLFAYSGNIQTQLQKNNLIPNNLDEIILFCPIAYEKGYLRSYTKRYTQKIMGIITCDAFEREALIFG